MLGWLRRRFARLFRGWAGDTGAPCPNQEDGTLYTRPATWEDLLQKTLLLNREGIRYIQIGSYALTADGYNLASLATWM